MYKIHLQIQSSWNANFPAYMGKHIFWNSSVRQDQLSSQIASRVLIPNS